MICLSQTIHIKCQTLFLGNCKIYINYIFYFHIATLTQRLKVKISGKIIQSERTLSACLTELFADNIIMLSMLGNNISRQHIEIFFSYFFQKTGFDISRKLSQMETICIKCQILFSGKNKKNIIDLLSAGFAQKVVKVKPGGTTTMDKMCKKAIPPDKGKRGITAHHK